MTTSNWKPSALITVTLPDSKWTTIRTALLCLACDASTAGNFNDSAHFMEAFKALKSAMGD